MEVAWAYGDMLIFHFSYTMERTYFRFNEVLERVKLGNPSPVELERLRMLHWDLALGVKV
jgi:hypothetical protein